MPEGNRNYENVNTHNVTHIHAHTHTHKIKSDEDESLATSSLVDMQTLFKLDDYQHPMKWKGLECQLIPH